ncbi:MAG: quinol:cytochrome C oxidoreductase [Flavobacteriales bacterium]|nr:MAG: quinol:cytochrome C oxidoreductase [Flavobacteriales bacterium]
MTSHGETGQRVWANLLVCGFFFFGISLGALFFYALQYATETAWTVMVKRVYEGMLAWLPIGAGVILLVLLSSTPALHWSHLYHWMEPTLYDSASPNYDAIMDGKKAFLNQPFFWIRTLAYVATFVFAAHWFRKESLRMDKESGETLVKSHLKNYRRGALFLVFFAVFSSTMSWDWLMAIDAHWFSTLFGWYVFSGMWVSAMITAVVIALYLKSKGYLPQVNNSHIHDMGKWVFAISFLWTYLFFSQFMLIWYANIPEEVTWFQTRWEHYMPIFWMTFFINFAIPMVLLMSRDAKRNPRFLIGVGTVIFIGHWLDVFMIVMPGTMHDHWHLGLVEVGLFLAFLGAFVYVTLNRLTKAPLTPVQHPYLEESIHHSI